MHDQVRVSHSMTREPSAALEAQAALANNKAHWAP
jgi:hypothetical protein